MPKPLSVSVLLGSCLMGAFAGLSAQAAPKAKPAPPFAPPPTPAAPSAADWRTPDSQNILVIDTNKGRIIVELYPLIAPAHVERVRALAHDKFYDGQSFFRVVDGFMDQTGDPTNTGTGGSKLPDLKAEFSFRRGADAPFAAAQTVPGGEIGFVGSAPVFSQSSDLMALTADGKVNAFGLFCAGTAGMARAGDPDSANSQFYLMRDRYDSLNRKYTVWGRVISGEDVVRAIKVGEPVDPPQDQMTSVRLAADLPDGQRPKVMVLDTRSDYFKHAVEAERAAKGADYSACEVSIPVKVQ